MYKFALSQLEFSDGTLFSPSAITVFVGANNVGKSRALKDIISLTTATSLPAVVVRNVGFTLPESNAAFFEAYDLRPHQRAGGFDLWALQPNLCGERQWSAGVSSWEDWVNRMLDRSEVRAFSQHFVPALIAHLTTEDRLQLVKESESPSHELQRNSILQQLYYAGSQTELEIRKEVQRAFDEQEIILDFSVPQRLMLRVGKCQSQVPPDPRDARPILARLGKLDDQGDGIRSFVGIVTALLAVKRDVVLIDEPEAFLHPPQSYRMGEFLAGHCSQAKQLMIATHSVDLLRGILSRNLDVSIIRIDRRDDKNTFRQLDSSKLRRIVTDPLLSSARVLDGLFYPGCVVVEADSDARFYQAVSRRIAGSPDLHFVNADNKQTVPRIMSIYKDLGVPCGGIVDCDVLNNESEFAEQLRAICPNDREAISVEAKRKALATELGAVQPDNRLAAIKSELMQIQQYLDSQNQTTDVRATLRKLDTMLGKLREAGNPWKEVKRDGRDALSPVAVEAFDWIAVYCASRGLFINPTGELESMLASYGIPHATDKREWIVRALQLIPGLQPDPFRQPWKLVRSIHTYLNGR